MSTERQIVANRLNAQRSTGPRTPAGKRRVASNALKHGLTGRQVVLPNENPDEFNSFREGLLAELAPQGALEGALTEKIISDLWRIRRVPILESALYRRSYYESDLREAAQTVHQYERTDDDRILASLHKTKVEASDREAHENAKQELESARAQLDDPSLKVAAVLERSSEPLLNLWRHEAALSGSVRRMLHELQRLQAERAGQGVGAPAVVDVDVSGSYRPDTGAIDETCQLTHDEAD